MALPYRPIRAAPAKDGTTPPRTLVERAVAKRSAIIKSACLECRKRKAKCNGQKPLCGSCSKYGRECVYDSDIRESRVNGLQQANQKLQDELTAAKLLMRHMAIGPAQLRSAVSEMLEEDRQPSEIIQILKNDESEDDKEGEVASNGLSSTLNDPTLPEVVSGTSHSFPVNSFSMKQQSSADCNSCIAIHSTTANSHTENPSTTCTAHCTFNEIFVDYTQSNTAAFVDNTKSIPLHPLQSSNIPANNCLLDEVPPVLHRQDNKRTATYQTEHTSLFFQPLFNQNDYCLSTSITTPILQETQDIVPTFSDVANESTHANFTKEQSRLAHEKLQHAAPGTHPNYENNFGNLALSDSIRVNGYPRHIQEAQIRNIFVPSWAATTLNTELDPGDMNNAFGDVHQQATSLLKKGEPVNRVIGRHPNIAALYDQDQFDRSCLLSQWAARMVHSVKFQGYDFTCFASMNVFWYMMRWMIDPSPETYAAMPEWIRPTTNQLFTPHISMADFILWPSFRDLVVQFPQLQERMAWLADMSMNIRCEWPYALEDALKIDPVDGTVDLVDLAKDHVWNLRSWSVGPSFRKFVLNADAYLQIRNA